MKRKRGGLKLPSPERNVRKKESIDRKLATRQNVYVSCKAFDYLAYYKTEHDLNSYNEVVSHWFASYPYGKPEVKLFEEATDQDTSEIAWRRLIACHPSAPFPESGLGPAPNIPGVSSKGCHVLLSLENVDLIDQLMTKMPGDPGFIRRSDVITFMRDNDPWRMNIVRAFAKKLGLKTMEEVLFEATKIHPTVRTNERTPRKQAETESPGKPSGSTDIQENETPRKNLFESICDNQEDPHAFPSASSASLSCFPRRCTNITEEDIRDITLSRYLHDDCGLSYNKMQSAFACFKNMRDNHNRSATSYKRDHFFLSTVEKKIMKKIFSEGKSIHLAVDCSPFMGEEILHGSLGGSKVFKCPSCGLVADRDAHAARNILVKNASLFGYDCQETLGLVPSSD